MNHLSRWKAVALAFFDRRPRWAPTWRGWLLLGALGVFTAMFSVRMVHPFLALNHPVDAEILVIEGWMPDDALRKCVPFIKAGAYQHVLTVGGPVYGVSSPAKYDDTHAYVAAARLYKMGLPPDAIEMVPTHTVNRDRTFHSASDLRRWLDERHFSPRGINVVTLGPHARRSRLLFQAALGKEVRVGIIQIENVDYDPAHWWRYSEGIKEVISETAGYMYARFLFYPPG